MFHTRKVMPLLHPPTASLSAFPLTRRLLFFSSLPPLLLSASTSNPNSRFSFSAWASMATSTPTPPVAKKVPRKMGLFGDVRMDNYYWLRDDSRNNPEVLSHLKAENQYTSLVMSGEIFLPSRLLSPIVH
jgi:oligopeptidase B